MNVLEPRKGNHKHRVRNSVNTKKNPTLDETRRTMVTSYKSEIQISFRLSSSTYSILLYLFVVWKLTPYHELSIDSRIFTFYPLVAKNGSVLNIVIKINLKLEKKPVKVSSLFKHSNAFTSHTVNDRLCKQMKHVFGNVRFRGITRRIRISATSYWPIGFHWSRAYLYTAIGLPVKQCSPVWDSYVVVYGNYWRKRYEKNPKYLSEPVTLPVVQNLVYDM